MLQVKLDTGFNIEIDFMIAPFIKRLFAWLIDICDPHRLDRYHRQSVPDRSGVLLGTPCVGGAASLRCRCSSISR